MKDVYRAVRNIFITFLIQGIIAIALGIFILIYPQILFILVALLFFLLGVTSLYIAIKIRRVMVLLKFLPK